MSTCDCPACRAPDEKLLKNNLYTTSDGHRCNLWEMCRREPEWAGNTIERLKAEKQQLEAVVTELTARWKETQDRCGAALAAVARLKTAAACPTLREAEIRAWVQAERVGAQPGPFMHPLTDDLDLVLEALDASRAIASEWKARFEETQHTGRCVCTDTNSDHDSAGVCTRCSCRHFEEQK